MHSSDYRYPNSTDSFMIPQTYKHREVCTRRIESEGGSPSLLSIQVTNMARLFLLVVAQDLVLELYKVSVISCINEPATVVIVLGDP